MEKIQNFILGKLDLLLKKEKTIFQLDKYRFRFLGEGSFGIIYKVTGEGNNIIVKIMKKEDSEPKKCLKIKEKISSLNDKEKKNLIEKYVTNILDVKLGIPNEVIFMEYLDGLDLSDFLNDEEDIDEELFYILVSKVLLAVMAFHQILKYSHRDLKLGNIFYNPADKNVKLIDFGFACAFNDYNCYNRYQGTSVYIHPKMNKKMLNNFDGVGNLKGIKSKKNNLNKNKKSLRKLSSNSSNDFSSFPKPRSQDIFSLVIIIFKMYSFINYERNLTTEEIKLNELLKRLFSHSHKNLNRREKFSLRYNKKNKFFEKLKTIKAKNISNNLIKQLITIIQQNWNLTENNFINSKKRDKSKKIFYDLLEISIKNVNNEEVRSELTDDKNIIYSK